MPITGVNGKIEIGGIILISQLDGYKKSQLGMFCEMLSMFLMSNFSENYQIAEDYCIAIDTFLSQTITYSDLSNGKIPSLIFSTIEDIKKL